MKRKFLVAVCLLMVFCLLPMEGMALRLGQVVRITNGGSINVRKGPSTDYNSIGTAKPDYIYIYLGTENNWHKIVYDDKVGYVSGNKSAVEAGLVPDEYTDGPKAEANVRITHNATLNIRKGPSKDTKVIGTAHPNDTYPYLSPANGWYAIRLSDGQTGYVAANRSQVEFLGVYDENGNFTSVTPTPSPTPKPTPKPTATPVPTLAPTPIPTVVPTLVPIVTAVPTAYYPTATPVPPFMPQGSVPCQHCGSTGVCITCNGFGAVYTYGQTSLAYCPTCYGNGRCLHCSGSGRQAVSW